MKKSQGKNKLKKSVLNHVLAVALTGLCAVSTAQAAFIDFGDYTHDTTTNLDWLAIGQTLNMSRTDVATATATGGSLEGWQYATLAQFATMAGEVLGNPSYTGDSGANATLAQASQVFDILGGSYGPTTRLDIYGMLAGSLIGGVSEHPAAYWINGQLGSASNAASWYGSMLVRTHLDAAPAAVPEPASLALLGLGFAGLLAGRRRKAA